MKKDLFIDNNIAKNFSNPQDKEYIKLTKWLLKFDLTDTENRDNYAHLVVSKKLIGEYQRTSVGTFSDTAIPIIIDKMQREGRLIFVSNQQIKDFKTTHYTKRVERSLRSNNEDREHIPLILLSDRKFALSYDDTFIYDLENFAGFTVKIEKRPEDLPYE